MDRRHFSIALGASVTALAKDLPMPMSTRGKSGLKVSKFCLGGYHMRVEGEANAIQMIHKAIDLGVNFLDSAAKYHNGESDVTYGKALKGGLRQKVLLMSKAEKRDKKSAMEQLETTLKRMQTDYLDLWQCHEVVGHDEVDKILAPDGSLEAFVEAKKQGKVRHIGFTGHADPTVHQRLLASFDGWETVQHPVNLIDPHYLSFIKNVLPRVGAKGLGRIGMKSNGIGSITKNGIATIQECLRFAWSQDIDTLVSGPQTLSQLEENIMVIKTFKKMTGPEISTLLERTGKGPFGSKIESYKKKEATASLDEPVHRDGEPV
jgi:predicted aldo/keto reductase-like oxidoreductase